MRTRTSRMEPALPALTAIALACGIAASHTATASSHREAPFITTAPKVDGTDFYMFRSYEAGRADFVTLIANYQPLQAPYGGPNYFAMDPNALYEIHVDNDGDAREDLTFQFRFQQRLQGDRAADRRQERGDSADPGGHGQRPARRLRSTSTRPTRSTSCAATAAAASVRP